MLQIASAHIVLTGITQGQRDFPYLTVLILFPVGMALLLACVPAAQTRLIRAGGMFASLVVLGIAAAVLDQFQAGSGGYQMVSDHVWVAPLGMHWTLGVDGISLFLLLMTALLFPIALAGATERVNPKAFTVWMLILEAGCIGSFLSIDLLLFFLFFETTLVPTYFLIAGWGHARRGYAATKFFIYTFAASAFMLVGILSLVFLHKSQTGVTTFDIRLLATTHLSGPAEVLLFCAFTAAFAVKAPIFPFHTWSPDAYGESPAAGSVILAGVMAKLGTYGIVRFDLGLFPHAVVELAPELLTLGAIGIIYGAIVAAVQKDLKRLVAYSSLAHLGFIVVGAFALTSEALSGAVLQMVNHGLYTAALFLLIAMIYRRLGTFSLTRMKGLQNTAPVMAAVFTVVMLASIGVPGLNGFIGEFLILAGTFLTHRWWAVVATSGVIFAAVYLLWAYQQAFHGKQELADDEAPFAELTAREGLVLAPLVILIVFLGVYPKPVLERITPSVDQIILHVEQTAHPVIPTTGQPTLTARVARPEARATLTARTEASAAAAAVRHEPGATRHLGDEKAGVK
jgi:NADH-quinone oxidoreductase subunit M